MFWAMFTERSPESARGPMSVSPFFLMYATPAFSVISFQLYELTIGVPDYVTSIP